jgi:hypothetical protein
MVGMQAGGSRSIGIGSTFDSTDTMRSIVRGADAIAGGIGAAVKGFAEP